MGPSEGHWGSSAYVTLPQGLSFMECLSFKILLIAMVQGEEEIVTCIVALKYFHTEVAIGQDKPCSFTAHFKELGKYNCTTCPEGGDPETDGWIVPIIATAPQVFLHCNQSHLSDIAI